MIRRLAQTLAYMLLAFAIAISLSVTFTAGIGWAVAAAIAGVVVGILIREWRTAVREEDARLDAEDDQRIRQDVNNYFCAGHGHKYEAVGYDWVCAHCGDVVRQPLNCAGRHRYVMPAATREQSLTCTVCGHRTELPYDQQTDVSEWEREVGA